MNKNIYTKKALVIINIGTPDKPKKIQVAQYLSEFLNDKRVLDIPYLFRKILVNGIIIPFRVGKSTKLYKQLWTEKGSPLLYNLNKLTDKLSVKLNGKYEVYQAMRFGKPSLHDLLNKLKNKNFEQITFLPLFPQYASSTTGSIVEKILNAVKYWEIIPSIQFINQFYNHKAFIRAFAKNIEQYKPFDFDHILFSYHGLPNRHIKKMHNEITGQTCKCEQNAQTDRAICYKAACYQTNEMLINALNLDASMCSIAFQSRFSKKWLSPFTDKVIADLANNGVKKLLIVAPSFVADCLETIVELEYLYNEVFIKNGGEKLILVKSLNDSDVWVDAIEEIVSKHFQES